MPASQASPHSCDNQLLALLTDQEHQSIARGLEPVDIMFKQVIASRGQPIEYVYFPCTAVFSTLAVMRDGGMVEVGTIGNEGFFGIDVLAGASAALETTICQIAGKALRMPAADFSQAIEGEAPLRQITQSYLLAYLSLVSQSVACNRLHTIEERFARWMLMTYDRVKGNEFPMTQEFLSQMLGTQRPSVSLVAGAFQQAGMIRYSRGKMTLLNREALEDIACECYFLVKEQFERNIGPFRK